MKKKSKMHPKGVVQITFRADEAKVLGELLTDAGVVVAFVVEPVVRSSGQPEYTVERIVRPNVKGV